MLHLSFIWQANTSSRHESESAVTQLCLTLSDSMDCSLQGFCIHVVSQARIMGWVVISLSRVSSPHRDGIQVSCTASRCFTLWATREARGMRANPKDEKRRGARHSILAPLCMSFLRPLSLPYVNRGSQEGWLFHPSVSLQSSDIPLFYFHGLSTLSSYCHSRFLFSYYNYLTYRWYFLLFKILNDFLMDIRLFFFPNVSLFCIGL